jgi:hypothetical protein
MDLSEKQKKEMKDLVYEIMDIRVDEGLEDKIKSLIDIEDFIAYHLDNFPQLSCCNFLIIIHKTISAFELNDWKKIVSKFENKLDEGHNTLIFFFTYYTNASVEFIEATGVKFDVHDGKEGFLQFYKKIKSQKESIDKIVNRRLIRQFKMSDLDIANFKNIGVG